MAFARLEDLFACASAGKITAKLLLSFLILSPTFVYSEPVAAAVVRPQQIVLPGALDDISAPGPVLGGGGPPANEGEHEFSLRHILHHGAYRYPELLRRLDIYPDTLVATEETRVLEAQPKYKLSSCLRPAARLKDRSKNTMEANLMNARRGMVNSYAADMWTQDPLNQPNITDKPTVLTLSKIAANAYVEVEGEGNWLEVGTPYNRTDDFGWEGDGLRGHIFADETNSTVIIGLKGTSSAVFDGAETTTNDKVNDNLLFSCCCARVSYFWTTVCDCYSGTAYTCNNTCLKDALMDESKYYRAALQLYYNVTQMYPDSDIWIVGHSLGGALSSLVAQTYGIPAVAFEAPGEAMASNRLGLPLPPGEERQTMTLPVYHFGHTADPVFMGTCNGPGSFCSIGGYAMESHCHAGSECVYDVVSDRGWRMSLTYHRILGVIHDVIETYDDVPECKAEPGCVDCYNWKFITGNETTTTTTTTTSPTPTTACTTPGWWGCRDPTSTAPILTPTTTTTSCEHYGWFGNCLDPITTTTSSPSTPTTTPPIASTISPTTSLSPTTTESCTHYGWFGGCLDPESSSPPTTTAPLASSSGCTEPGRLWGCWDKPTSAPIEAELR